MYTGICAADCLLCVLMCVFGVSLHHKSYNPGPWSGLSMHPIEHLMYYSCAWLLPLFFTIHPVSASHTASVAPIAAVALTLSIAHCICHILNKPHCCSSLWWLGDPHTGCSCISCMPNSTQTLHQSVVMTGMMSPLPMVLQLETVQQLLMLAAQVISTGCIMPSSRCVLTVLLSHSAPHNAALSLCVSQCCSLTLRLLVLLSHSVSHSAALSLCTNCLQASRSCVQCSLRDIE